MSEWDEDTGPYCGGGHYNDPQNCFECHIKYNTELKKLLRIVKSCANTGRYDSLEEEIDSFEDLLNKVPND